MKGVGYLIGGVIGAIICVIGLILTAITHLDPSGNVYAYGIVYALLMAVGFVVAVSLFDMRRA
ncbi:MAG: hypothetical protein M0Z77_04285 [Thermoplasmatales archaeon]|jgi:hypothetical protein|nr:hypothetical protein [Candidatus Thermoplasmatota archaeon]MCL6002752.1 hypothetical protein [Candidatus Thermoplasmatota archaeon]MDA8054854.1 hypothetical protein [Thermoplasmatales archaeon]